MLETNQSKTAHNNESNKNFERMQQVLTELVTGESIVSKIEIGVEDMIRKLSFKMNADLSLIPMETWKKIKELCWSVRKYDALNCLYPMTDLSINDIVNKTLKLYKNADKGFYTMAKSLLEDKRTNLYINDLKIDSYYRCALLNCDFLACSLDGYHAYTGFIHELQHGLNFEMFPYMDLLYNELGPIFFELLMCDKLNDGDLYPGLYGERFEDNNYVMESVFDYVGVLEKFDYKGRDLTAENIGVILGVDSEEELRQIYNKYYCDDFIESVGYIISFMQAIEIRATYYNSRKRGIIQLKDTINNPDINLDYDSLIWHYEDFVDEIEQSRVRSYTKKKRT